LPPLWFIALSIGGGSDGMNNERDIIVNTQPYAEDLGVSQKDNVAPGSIVDKVPVEFVCFPEHGRNPRKFRKVEHDSYDMLLWLDGKWRFTDNISEDYASDWFRHSDCDVYVR
jgi:hypothetical protein